ncbi:hypothetical protein ACFQBQ_00880 [Granulicella cerasi]|uniref:Uncharacterized protein n=1 Tax=Granulicella cerasi TaxID=741063 RepID=A0ABW1Z6R8_9BACT
MLAILALPGAVAPLQAQSVTKIEDYGSVSATTIKNGLGFNVNPANAWEFQQAAAAGATEVRIQCGWQATEVQTAQNTSGGYVLPAGCVTAMQSAKTYSLHPLMIAAYGPPYQAIVTLKTTADVPVGVYNIPVTATTGTLSQINVPYCQCCSRTACSSPRWAATPTRARLSPLSTRRPARSRSLR